MRFLHTDFAPVHDFLTTNLSRINRLEWELHPIASGYPSLSWMIKRRPARPPQPATIAEVEAYVARTRSPKNAGTVLLHYFHVNAPPSDHAISLSGAVEHVEAYGNVGEFVLAAYPDGGFVSVSRHLLPFQDGVAQVKWWGP